MIDQWRQLRLLAERCDLVGVSAGRPSAWAWPPIYEQSYMPGVLPVSPNAADTS